MANTKKVRHKSEHQLYQEAREEVEGNVKAGPITRLVEIPNVGDLNEADKPFWLRRLHIEREILLERHDKQASRKPPAELARQKCERLLLENAADRMKVQSNGNLWQAIAAAEMRALRAEAHAIEAHAGLSKARLGMMRMAQGLAGTLEDVCPNCGDLCEEKDGE